MIVNPCEKVQLESLKLSSIYVPRSDSIRYLGTPFDSSIRATCALVINELKKKLRKTYGMLKKLKGNLKNIH